MEPPLIQPFIASDLEKLVDAWCRSAPQDGVTVERFRDLVLLDRNFDRSGLNVAKRQSGEIIGASYGVRRRVAHYGADLEAATGWIPFFFVTPESRGLGIGTRLVAETLSWLKRKGTSEAVFSSYTPNYVLPGLDRERYPIAGKILDRLGFQTVESADAMEFSLRDYSVPESVQERIDAFRAEGWQLRSPHDGELVDLIEIAHTFNSDWARAIREGILNGVPNERVLVAINPEGKMLGWAMHGTYEHVVDRFGPFGVLPESRGTGIGKVLLHLTMQRMMSAGAHTSWFLWADRGSVASKLYKNTGYEVTRTFEILKTDL